jgi:hypothetical protein
LEAAAEMITLERACLKPGCCGDSLFYPSQIPINAREHAAEAEGRINPS